MSELSDAELATAAQAGDLQSFGELARRYQNTVFAACYRMLGERFDAEDLAQDAFLRASQRLHLYDTRRPFGPWVRRLAVNLCLNHLESERLTAPLDDETGNITWSSDAQNPERLQVQVETGRTVQAALLALSPRQRAVIELRHFQELSYAEIAAAMNLPLSDVKSDLFRARRRLAELLRSDE